MKGNAPSLLSHFLLCMSSSFFACFLFLLLIRHISCACTTIKLILKSFASVIMSNIKHQTTPTAGQGIDLAREERFAL